MSIERGAPENLKVISRSNENASKDANIAVFTNPKHEVFLVEKEYPVAKEGQAIVNVKACGICGSDLHFAKEGRIGEMIVTDIYGLGHEGSGQVVSVGPGVTKLKPGDRVAIECGISCMKRNCEECSNGFYNLCPDGFFYSTPPYDGIMTRFHCQDVQYLHKIPDKISYEEAALLEPLSVAVQGINHVKPQVGDPVVVLGSGSIGLMFALLLRSAGAAPIYIFDHIQDRINSAKKLLPWAKHIKVNPNLDAKTLSEAFLKENDNVNVRSVFECSGIENFLRAGIFMAGKRAIVHVVGCGKNEMLIPIQHLQAREIQIHAQYRYHHTWEKAIRLVEEGQINIKPLASHFVPLNVGFEAFDIASDFSKNATKVLIVDK